jgi:hypothetical protein
MPLRMLDWLKSLLTSLDVRVGVQPDDIFCSSLPGMDMSTPPCRKLLHATCKPTPLVDQWF